MAMDLIVRGANLPDGRVGMDIGVKDSRIAAVEPLEVHRVGFLRHCYVDYLITSDCQQRIKMDSRSLGSRSRRAHLVPIK